MAMLMDWFARHALSLAWCAALALVAGAQWLRAEHLSDELDVTKAQAQARFERQARVYAEEAARAADAAASESARRIAAQEAIADEARSKAAQARADAASAVDAAGRLRQRFAAVADRACSGGAADHPAAAASGPPAAEAGAVLSDVLERVAGAARQLAEHADDARIAGAACERYAESLRPAGR